MRRCRICFVVSSALTVQAFLREHLQALSLTYDVDVVIDSAEDAAVLSGMGLAAIHRVPIVRTISPAADFASILRLTRILRAGGYDAVHSITPKAGLIAAISACLARVPARFHMFTGQVWATSRGFRRTLLRAVDRLIVALDTHVLVDSASQRDFLRSEGVLGRTGGEVLAGGSVSGVDSGRFKPDAEARTEVRAQLSIPTDALVFLFVGRLNRDKGVLELAQAFAAVAAKGTDAYLLLVGPDEAALSKEILRLAHTAERVRLVPLTASPERYMAASDVLCLPSYREGFGSVIIEAAAAGLPAIASRIYGLVDAVADGATGMLIPPRDPEALAAAMKHLSDDAFVRAKFGRAARERAIRDFSAARVTAALVSFYARALPDCSR